MACYDVPMECLRTEWVLIDGAPSSGKTTVIQALHRAGYRIIPEVGRAYIELELARGRMLGDIRGNEEYFQRALIALYTEQFQRLNPRQSVILDGGFPHAQAYIDLNRTPNMPDVLALCRPFHFKKVFLCDPLPFEDDHVRTEDATKATFLDRRIGEIYQELGYDPLRIPVMTVEERAAYVLQNLPSAEAHRIHMPALAAVLP